MVSTEYDREVCIMQDAETVLNVIRERGERGLLAGEHLSAALQPGLVPAGLRSYLLKPGSDNDLLLSAQGSNLRWTTLDSADSGAETCQRLRGPNGERLEKRKEKV